MVDGTLQSKELSLLCTKIASDLLRQIQKRKGRDSLSSHTLRAHSLVSTHPHIHKRRNISMGALMDYYHVSSNYAGEYILCAFLVS